MGSPLGVTFANFYMCHVENQVLQHHKPKIYARYVDDIATVTKDTTELQRLRHALENHSVLKFTHEEATNNTLNFLDVHIDANSDTYTTSVYQKPTSQGIYLNARSECPERYKIGTIHALIHRTYKISSTWNLFHDHITPHTP